MSFWHSVIAASIPSAVVVFATYAFNRRQRHWESRRDAQMPKWLEFLEVVEMVRQQVRRDRERSPDDRDHAEFQRLMDQLQVTRCSVDLMSPGVYRHHAYQIQLGLRAVEEVVYGSTPPMDTARLNDLLHTVSHHRGRLTQSARDYLVVEKSMSFRNDAKAHRAETEAIARAGGFLLWNEGHRPHEIKRPQDR